MSHNRGLVFVIAWFYDTRVKKNDRMVRLICE